MQQIKLADIEATVAGKFLFSAAALTASTGDVIGIVGHNGAGKTTLMKIISDDSHAFTGQRHVAQSVMIVDQVLPFDERSGGQTVVAKVRTALAAKTAILILDEPTTNLDQQHQSWLVSKIKQYAGTLLVVSHDQNFLRQIATKIWAIEDQTFHEFNGTFDEYCRDQKQITERQQQEYERQHRQERQLKQAVQQRQQKAQKIRRGSRRMGRLERANTKSIREQNAGKMEQGAKALLKRAERQVKVTKPVTSAKIKLMPTDFPVFHGKTVLRTNDLMLERNGHMLLRHTTMALKPGERLALMGPNGSGKSALITWIIGHNQQTQISPRAKVGYFNQDLTQLDGQLTVWQLLSRVGVLDDDRTRQIAGAFGVHAAVYDQRIDTLSGGERVKLQVLSVIISDSNVLILDEPTNFLDDQALAALADYLVAYPGTVLFVSHDEAFVNQVATRRVVIEHQLLRDPTKTVLQARPATKLPLLQLKYDRLMADPDADSGALQQLKREIEHLKL